MLLLVLWTMCDSQTTDNDDNDDYFCTTDYLRIPKCSLTNRYIYRGNTQFFTKIVVDGSGDRTTSEESWLYQKTQMGFIDVDPIKIEFVIKLCAKYVLALNLLNKSVN